jgi:3-oxoacyl-[acyl-carrier protein] reductase
MILVKMSIQMLDVSKLLRLANFGLANKTAIVTGAGQGMGEAFAKILAINGARVVVCDLNDSSAVRVANEIRSIGGEARPYEADVSNAEAVSKMVRFVKDQLGYPEILVNNAGVLKSTPFQDITESEWNSIMKVNVDSVFYCCRYVAPLMIERKYGKIVNMSSTAGKSASTFGGLHYTASKASVLGITRHLAMELAPFNINVNAICPGSIDTPMIRGNATESRIKEAEKKIPFGRLGAPEEVANLVLFLSSDASSYITGASIDINGAELLV